MEPTRGSEGRCLSKHYEEGDLFFLSCPGRYQLRHALLLDKYSELPQARATRLGIPPQLLPCRLKVGTLGMAGQQPCSPLSMRFAEKSYIVFTDG
jgi:hypothetical protein